MDDLILAGALSILALYAAVILAGAGVILVLIGLYNGIISGNNGRVAAILGIILLFLAAYAGCGFLLRKTGRT